MAYNLLLLLEKSNIDLKERNKNYIRIITDIEKKITDFFIDYDYSGIFQDSLNNLYKQVSNFSEDLFSEFISFVNKVYENYTIIYNNAFNDKYDFIRQIISVTREEYIQLIYNIIDIMKIFENNILIFLGDLEKEIDVLEDFQIDLLYDIKDKIYEAKLILKKINKNMFKSIEKSFLYFQNDIYEGVDEILDDILYIIDFLASNINRNEIMQKTINYELRISTTSNLTKIKDIIISIIDMTMLNINKDYNYQMNLTNQNGIKKHAIQKTNEILTNIE
jgi:hypothetical protein